MKADFNSLPKNTITGSSLLMSLMKLLGSSWEETVGEKLLGRSWWRETARQKPLEKLMKPLERSCHTRQTRTD